MEYFIGQKNRVINAFGKRYDSGDKGELVAETMEESTLFKAYGFEETGVPHEEDEDKKTVEEVVAFLEESKEEIENVCVKSTSFIEFIIEFIKKFFK